jgi:hypothetical protein
MWNDRKDDYETGKELAKKRQHISIPNSYETSLQLTRLAQYQHSTSTAHLQPVGSVVRDRTGEGVATPAVYSDCLFSDTGNLKSAITYINLNYYMTSIINDYSVIDKK